MEEGTGISLYILVGIIIFSLFVSISVLFGEGILANSGDIIACVESYMSDGPTECGKKEDEDEELPEVGSGLREFYYEAGAGNQMSYYVNQLSDALTSDIDGFEDTLYHKYLNSVYSNKRGSQYIYGVYDSGGNLIDQYEGGDRDFNKGELTIFYNDIRLIPQDVIDNAGRTGMISNMSASNGYMSFKGYVVRDAQGRATRHYVPEKFTLH